MMRREAYIIESDDVFQRLHGCIFEFAEVFVHQVVGLDFADSDLGDLGFLFSVPFPRTNGQRWVAQRTMKG